MLPKMLRPERRAPIEELMRRVPRILRLHRTDLHRKIQPDIGEAGIVAFAQSDRQSRRRPRDSRYTPSIGDPPGSEAEDVRKCHIVVETHNEVMLHVERGQGSALPRKERVQIASRVIDRLRVSVGSQERQVACLALDRCLQRVIVRIRDIADQRCGIEGDMTAILLPQHLIP